MASPTPARPATWHARLAPGFLKLEAGADSLRLDALGRWATARLDGAFLRRRLDGGLVVRGPDGVPTDHPPGSPLHDAVQRRALALGAQVLAGHPLEGAPTPEVAAWLSRAADWDARRWAREPARFAEAYPEPIPILPPDRYRDLVVLPALGCPHGACGFCAWYREARFTVPDVAEFERHLDRVQGLLGPSVTTRNGLFLGSASAFSVPDRVLLDRLERTRRRFGPFERGVAGFLDPDHAPRRGVEEFRRLAEAGVRRIVVGLETGEPGLRAALGKTADLSRFVETGRAARAGGVTLGVTVLAGVGGPDQQEAHLASTRAALASLGLGRDDLVYVSPLAGGAPGVDPEAAARRLTRALRRGAGPAIAPYRMDLYRAYAW